MVSGSSSIDQNIIILVFSDLLREECFDEDASPGGVDCGDDLNEDDEEAEPNSRALAHVELARRAVREFVP